MQPMLAIRPEDLSPVLVEWTDSYTITGWQMLQDVIEIPIGGECRTVGYLLHETDDFMIIALSVDIQEGMVLKAGEVMFIPKVVVKTVTKLTPNTDKEKE